MMEKSYKINLTKLKDSDYNRPKKTYTERLNENQDNIIDKLEDYVGD